MNLTSGRAACCESVDAARNTAAYNVIRPSAQPVCHAPARIRLTHAQTRNDPSQIVSPCANPCTDSDGNHSAEPPQQKNAEEYVRRLELTDDRVSRECPAADDGAREQQPTRTDDADDCETGDCQRLGAPDDQGARADENCGTPGGHNRPTHSISRVSRNKSVPEHALGRIRLRRGAIFLGILVSVSRTTSGGAEGNLSGPLPRKPAA